MKRNEILAAAAVLFMATAGVQACGSSSGNTNTGGSTSSSSSSTTTTTSSSSTTTTSSSSTTTTSSSSTSTSSSSGGPPAPPTLGAQIDRMGRPAINTALNHAFDPTAATKTAAKDAWNAANDPTKWVATFTPEVEKNLAILDALDGNCGNQALADKTKTDATRYGTLAGALADDRLWLKSDATTCTTYLAVEANVTGLKANMDCGGRGLNYDVMDETYSLLAAGALSGVGDGINMNDATNTTTFPYMAAPH